VTELVWPLYKR